MAKKTKIAAEVKRIFGEEVESVRPMFLEKLSEGVIVDLDIRFWRAKSSLNHNDLGLPKDVEKKLFMLGRKYLLPIDLVHQIENIESRARKIVTKRGIPSYWGQFVHYSEWEELTSELKGIQDEWDELGKEIQSSYAKTVRQHKLSYAAELDHSWDQIKKLSGRSRKIETKESFIQVMMKEFSDSILTLEEFMERYQFEISVRRVQLPEEIEKNNLSAQRVREEQILQRQKFDAKQQVTNAKEQLELKKIQSKKATYDEINAKKQEMMEAMHRAVVDSARKQKNERIDGFMLNFATQMRSILHEAAADLLDAIRKNGKLPSRSMLQIKNLQKNIEKMNSIFQDDECDQMLQAIKLAARKQTSAGTKESEDILGDVETAMRISLVNLSAAPRSRAVEIDFVPTDSDGQRARGRITNILLAEEQAMMQELETTKRGKIRNG